MRVRRTVKEKDVIKILVFVLQAMDAAGKDGTVKHVFSNGFWV